MDPLTEILRPLQPALILPTMIAGAGAGLVASRIPPIRYGHLGVFTFGVGGVSILHWLTLAAFRVTLPAVPPAVVWQTVGTLILSLLFTALAVSGMVIGRRLTDR